MTAHFQRVSQKKLGYDVEQVDEVINAARRQFADPALHEVSSQGIRNSEFRLVRGGYSVQSVDEALQRLDDSFAVQEIQRLLAQTGQHGLEEKARHLMQLITGRLSRKKRRRFKRVSLVLKGYSPRQVDRFLGNVGASLNNPILASELSDHVEQLRSVSFSLTWGGYAEEQVDAIIDRLVQLVQIRAAL